MTVTNNRIRSQFPYEGDPEGHAHRALASLDGKRWFSRLLSQNFADPSSGPSFIESETDFLQCAGSAEALTVELSELCDDGLVRRWVLGREGELADEKVLVRWSDTGRSEVSANEVWTSEQAVSLFVAYYEGGPEAVVATRRLDEEYPRADLA